MYDAILIYWILIFIILLAIHLSQESTVFGMISALWLLLLGLGILVTGVQISSGMTITTAGATQTITYNYADVAPPFSTYSYMWGLILIAIFLYMFFTNAEKRWGKKT